MIPKTPRLAHVIASQGHRRRFLDEYNFQPWVENINKILKACGFQIVLLSAGDHSGIYFSNDRKLKIVIRKKVGLLNDYFSIFLSFTMLVTKKPDFVIVHGLQHYLTLIALIAYGLLKRTPLLLLVHGIYEASDPVELLRDKFIKSLFKLLNKTNTPVFLLSLTHYDKANLINKWRVADSRVFVSLAPLFMSLDEIRVLSKTESATRKLGNQCTLLYLGRLSQEKRIDKIILAFDKLLKKGYNARLIIVGGGPLEQQIISLVKKLRLNNAIDIKGIVWGDKKWNFYLESDALVLASKHEGLPRVIIEAFAAGKFVVAPRISGIPEVVEHGINGFLFENEEELAETLEDFAQRINSIRNISIANKKIVMDRMILETKGLKEFRRILGQLRISMHRNSK